MPAHYSAYRTEELPQISRKIETHGKYMVRYIQQRHSGVPFHEISWVSVHELASDALKNHPEFTVGNLANGEPILMRVGKNNKDSTFVSRETKEIQHGFKVHRWFKAGNGKERMMQKGFGRFPYSYYELGRHVLIERLVSRLKSEGKLPPGTEALVKKMAGRIFLDSQSNPEIHEIIEKETKEAFEELKDKLGKKKAKQLLENAKKALSKDNKEFYKVEKRLHGPENMLFDFIPNSVRDIGIKLHALGE